MYLWQWNSLHTCRLMNKQGLRHSKLYIKRSTYLLTRDWALVNFFKKNLVYQTGKLKPFEIFNCTIFVFYVLSGTFLAAADFLSGPIYKTGQQNWDIGILLYYFDYFNTLWLIYLSCLTSIIITSLESRSWLKKKTILSIFLCELVISQNST